MTCSWGRRSFLFAFFLVFFLTGRAGADVTGVFDLHLLAEPQGTQTESVKFNLDLQANLDVKVTVSGLTYGTDLGFGTTGVEFSVLNLAANLGGATLRNQTVFAVPFVSLDLNHSPSMIRPTIDRNLDPNGVAFVSHRMTVEANLAGITVKNEAIFEDVDFPNPFGIPPRNNDDGDMNRDGCPGLCGVDDDGDGFADFDDPDVINANDDDEDGRVDEDPIGDANQDGCPGRCGVDDDNDGLVDEDSLGREPGDPGYNNDLVDDDDEDGLVDEDQGDALFDEDPFGDANGDGCPGVCGVDDDGDGIVDEGSVNDDDEDGLVDEDVGKTVYFLGELDNVSGNQTPSFAFGDRFTITGQTVSGITVLLRAGLCFKQESKVVKKRSFSGSVNPECVGELLPPDPVKLRLDFISLLVQNVSVGGLVLNLTGNWEPLDEVSSLKINTTLGLLGIANLRVAYETEKLTDLEASNALQLTLVGENFRLNLSDSEANLDIDTMSIQTSFTLNANEGPVRFTSNTSVSKGTGITSQSFTLSVTRQPLTFNSTTAYGGGDAGEVTWQSTNFALTGQLGGALDLKAELTFTPEGMSAAKAEIGVVF